VALLSHEAQLSHAARLHRRTRSSGTGMSLTDRSWVSHDDKVSGATYQYSRAAFSFELRK
jgi:hypothetical protein